MFKSTKKKGLTSAFALLSICSFAQSNDIPLPMPAPCNSPVKVWEKRYGGNKIDNLEAAGAIKGGGYILGGYSWSDAKGERKTKPKGFNDYWIVRTDANGSLLWEKGFGGTENDKLKCTIATADGGFLLGGDSESEKSGDKTGQKYGIWDYWLVKTDAQGKKIWDKTYGGESDEYLSAIVPAKDGGYLLAGFTGSYPFASRKDTLHGNYDFWIVKIDANGNQLWDRTFGGEGIEQLKTAIPTSDGGYLLGGTSQSGVSGNKTSKSKGEGDFWIVKIDANGNQLWDKSYGGNGEDNLKTILETYDGGYILGGESSSAVSGDKTEPVQGENDYWIVKTDANGTKLWDKRFGGNASDWLTSVVPSNDGGYILAGHSWSKISGNKTVGSTGAVFSTDFWLVKINDKGTQIWDMQLGGNGDEVLSGVIDGDDGTYLLTGTTRSDISGDIKEVSRGDEDFWVIKIATCK